jgi:hypothetical protein
MGGRSPRALLGMGEFCCGTKLLALETQQLMRVTFELIGEGVVPALDLARREKMSTVGSSHFSAA